MIQVGHIVVSSKLSDFCLVELNSSVTNVASSFTSNGHLPGLDTLDTPVLSSPGGKPQIVERVSRATDICLLAGSSGTVHGRLQAFSHDVKLPLSNEFQPIYIIQLDSPVMNGDSGSMVRDAAAGGVFGYIIAVNRTGNTAMEMPIGSVLDSIQKTANQRILVPQLAEDNRALVSHIQAPTLPLEFGAGMGIDSITQEGADPTSLRSDNCDFVCGKRFYGGHRLRHHIRTGKCEVRSPLRFPCKLCDKYQGVR
jgi:hypothetical protein